MAKTKERNETEYLRSVIRQLKSENRNLKKQLAHAGKHSKKVEALLDIVSDPEDSFSYSTPEHNEDATPKCPKCRSSIKAVDMGVRTFYYCTNTNCKHKFTTRK